MDVVGGVGYHHDFPVCIFQLRSIKLAEYDF